MSGATSDDEEFERIVAGLELSMPELDLPGDAPASDLDDRAADRFDRPEPRDAFASYDVFQPTWSDAVDEEDDDPTAGDFVPPDPDPLPPGDRVTRWAWGGLIGGPAVLFLLAVAGVGVPDVVATVAVVAFVGGLLVLLFRRGDHDRGDDPDHGAVV